MHLHSHDVFGTYYVQTGSGTTGEGYTLTTTTTGEPVDITPHVERFEFRWDGFHAVDLLSALSLTPEEYEELYEREDMKERWYVYEVVFHHNETREISGAKVSASSETSAIIKAAAKLDIPFYDIDSYTVDADDLFVVPAPSKARAA